MNEMDLYNMDPQLLERLLSMQMLGPQEQEQARMFAQADELRGLGTDPGAGQMVGGRWMPNYAGAAQRGMGAYHGDKMQRQASGMGEGIAQERMGASRDYFNAMTQRRQAAAQGMAGQAPQQVTQAPMPQQGGMMPPGPQGPFPPAPPGNPMQTAPQGTPMSPWAMGGGFGGGMGR
jgi:hypothetical protein